MPCSSAAARPTLANPTTATHELHQPAAAMMVLRVGLEMLRQVFDSAGQQGHLDLRRACIRAVELVVSDDVVLLFFG